MPARQFTISTEGEIQSPAARVGLLSGNDKRWDARLRSCKQESWNGWDPSTRKPDGKSETFLMLTFERNVQAVAGREDEHYAEVYSVIHREVAKQVVAHPGKTISIKVVSSDGKETTWLHQDYLQSAYEVCTLGKFRKASPEVEALIRGETAFVPSANKESL